MESLRRCISNLHDAQKALGIDNQQPRARVEARDDDPRPTTRSTRCGRATDYSFSRDFPPSASRVIVQATTPIKPATKGTPKPSQMSSPKSILFTLMVLASTGDPSPSPRVIRQPRTVRSRRWLRSQRNSTVLKAGVVDMELNRKALADALDVSQNTIDSWAEGGRARGAGARATRLRQRVHRDEKPRAPVDGHGSRLVRPEIARGRFRVADVDAVRPPSEPRS